MDFRETKRIEWPISDMRVHVHYEAQLSPPWLPAATRDGRLIFTRGFATEADRQESVGGLAFATEAERRAEIATGIRSMMSPKVNLDAFKVRDQFRDLDTTDESAVLVFLNTTGSFWPLGSVTPEQIWEWQQFTEALLCNNLTTMPRKVRRALSGYTKECFYASYDRGYDAAEILRETPPGKKQAMEKDLARSAHHRQNMVSGLVQWFLWPQADALVIFPPFREKKRHPGITAPPQVEIAAMTVLEAVAACAYVERFGAVQYRNCKYCKRNFKVEPGHSGEFCTDRHSTNFRQWKKYHVDKEKAAALERARRKKKAAAKVAQKNPSAIQRPKTTFKRGTK